MSCKLPIRYARVVGNEMTKGVVREIPSSRFSMALLLLATAKIDGDLSSEEKSQLLQMFEHSFSQSSKEASSLLGASSYLLGDGEEVYRRPHDVLSQSIDKFSQTQKESSMELLKQISEVGGAVSETQRGYIESIRSTMLVEPEARGWQ